jgi:hypothetical protein
MSSSNISSVTKTADAAAISGRTRVVGIYYTCTGTGSSFSLKNGSTSGGTALVSITTLVLQAVMTSSSQTWASCLIRVFLLMLEMLKSQA